MNVQQTLNKLLTIFEIFDSGTFCISLFFLIAQSFISPIDDSFFWYSVIVIDKYFLIFYLYTIRLYR